MDARELFNLMKENEEHFDPRFIAYDDNKKMAVCDLAATMIRELGTPQRAFAAIDLYLETKKTAAL